MFKTLVVLVLVCAAILVMASAPRGVEARKQLAVNRRCCDFSLLAGAADDGARSDRRRHLPLRDRPGQVGDRQDVSRRPNGFFPRRRLRARHHRLEHQGLEERGWTGICVDPFPTHMEAAPAGWKSRRLERRRAVVKFHTHSGLGGIADTLGKWKEEAEKSPGGRAHHHTLGEVLDGAGAPSFIHFLSLDIEGAELEALKGVPFDKYRFGAMAIEHNDEEPKRRSAEIPRRKGYRAVHSYKQDDFYAPRLSRAVGRSACASA
jgi:hypothetical protein